MDTSPHGTSSDGSSQSSPSSDVGSQDNGDPDVDWTQTPCMLRVSGTGPGDEKVFE